MIGRGMNLGAAVALALGSALSSFDGPVYINGQKREAQPVNVNRMSNRQKKLYEAALRRKARQERGA